MKSYLNKIKYTALALAGVLTISSCSDNFLELAPHDKTSVNIMYKTASDFNLAVIGVYSKLQGQIGFFNELNEYRSDNLNIDAPTAGTQDRYDIDQFQDKASNGILESAWANYNNGVYRANMVLDRIDAANFDANLKKQYKGEALFLRAMTYFNMYRIWGGVPITSKVVSLEEAFSIKRSSEEEMMAFIVNDLKEIVNNQLLPVRYSNDQAGRATLGAAQTLLGKVYLTFHKWEEARDILAQVIGKYTLLQNPADVFSVDNKMNDEIIFAIRFNKAVPTEGHGFWYSIPNLNANTGQSTELKEGFETGDLRKDLISFQSVPGETNVFAMKKFMDVRNLTTNNVGNDFIVLRYADVLLMYAEALNRISFDNSDNGLAMTALNEVRTRAGLQAISSTDVRVANQAAFNKAIAKERQFEFPYEGHRWYDLVRMGLAKEVMSEVGHNIADHQLLYPIPTTVLERINNTSLVWQNPGY